MALVCHVRESKFWGVIMNEFFQSVFQLIYPLHCVKGGEAGVLFRVLDVGKCVESQKLWCTAQLGSLSVKVLFEVLLLFLEFFFGALSVLLVVVRVVNEDNEVNSQIKLKFLSLEILFEALFGWLQQLLPRFEKVVFCAAIET